MATHPRPPTAAGDLTDFEIRLQRRVRYARPLALPGVELVWLTAWGDHTPPTVDPRYQLVRMDHSHAVVRHSAKEFAVTTGMVSVATPHVAATVVRRESVLTRGRIVLVEPGTFRALRGDTVTPRSRQPRYLMQLDPPLRGALDSLFRSITAGAPKLAQQSALLACVVAASRALGVPDIGLAAMPVRVRKAISFLHDRFADDVTLEDLAEAVGGDLHPRYLLSVFTQEVGIAPHQYVLRLRIRKAKELLARGLSAASVAPAVGFCDAPQLHRHFVRLAGLTPAAYAKAVR